MAKFIWLNGAFGAGKTTVAEELRRRLNAFVYDPEEAGFLIRKSLPKSLHTNDFQDHPEWRLINNILLRRIDKSYDGVVIIPMTIRNAEYYRELVDGVAVYCHVVLYTTHETLMERIKSRGEDESSFAAEMAEECLRAFDESFPRELPEAVKLMTDCMTVSEVADAVENLACMAFCGFRCAKPSANSR